MARDTRDILFRFLGDSKDLQQATKQADKSVGSFSKGMKGAAGAAAGLGLALGAAEVANWAKDAVGLAMAAEEVDSKFEAVFGTATDLTAELEAWGDMAGVTTTDAKNLAATFGNLAQAQGIGAAEAEAMALETAKLAGDLASFNDADPAKVYEDLNKALLTTEREGMKKYGIAITQADVDQRALAKATAEGRTEVTKADKAYASMAIAAEQAGKAVGDLERTQDSAANQQRKFNASLKEVQETIGRELLPVAADLLDTLNDLTPAIKAAASAAGSTSAGSDSSPTRCVTPSTWRHMGRQLHRHVDNAAGGLMRSSSPGQADVKELGEGVVATAETVFKEFADTSQIVADALDQRVKQAIVDSADATRDLAAAQAEYRTAVEQSYGARSEYDVWLAGYLAKVRAINGLGPLQVVSPAQPDQGQGYFGDGQFNPPGTGVDSSSRVYRNTQGYSPGAQ